VLAVAAEAALADAAERTSDLGKTKVAEGLEISRKAS
jgi:hypothetical protein